MKKSIFLLALIVFITACGLKDPAVKEAKTYYTAETLFREENYEWLSSCYDGTSMYDIGRNDINHTYELWKYDGGSLDVTKTILFPQDCRFVRAVLGCVADGVLHTLCGTLDENETNIKDYFLCTFDSDGNIKDRRNITESISHIMDQNYVGFNYSYVLPDDRILIFGTYSSGTKMNLLSEDGKVIVERTLGDLNLFDCQIRENGKAMLLEYCDSGRKISLSEIDIDSGKRSILIEDLHLPYGTRPSFVWGCDPDMIYYKTDECIWRYDAKANELCKILSFEDSLLDGRCVGYMWQRKEGDWCLYYFAELIDEHNASAYATDFVCLKKEDNYIDSKTELTYAVIGPENLFKADAIAFNLLQEQVKINVKVYDEEERFLADMIAGNIPDVINLDDLEIYNALRNKGLLENLNPYFDQDKGLSMNDFLPMSLEFYKEDDKIYSIPYGLVLNAMMGDEKYFEGIETWDFSQFKAFLDSVPDKSKITSGCSNQEILFQMCFNYMDHFVDHSTGTCDFQTKEFMELLEAAACFSQEEQEDELLWEKRRDAVLSGDTVLEMVSIGEFPEYEYKRALFPGKGKIIGFPADYGKGISIMSGGIAPAMTTACMNKSAAWDFIKFTLTKEKNHLYTSIFPSYKPVFYEMIEEARERSGEVYSVKYEDEAIDVPCVTLSEIEELQKLLNEGYPSKGSDMNILQIICEEADGYFKGDIGLDDVTSSIQNRVSLYLREQK